VGDVPFDPCRECDDVATLKAAARQGLGIVALPAYVAREEIQKGEWVRVLPQWTAGVATVSLLMPSRRGLLPSVRPFAEFLAERVPDIVEGSAPLMPVIEARCRVMRMALRRCRALARDLRGHRFCG
jgi:hypothetical protein